MPDKTEDRGADNLRETAREAGDEAARKAERLKAEARETAGKAKDRAVEEAERGKDRGASELRRWKAAMRRAAEELGEDSTQGELVMQAADGLDDLAARIEGRSIGQMVEGVQDFARRNPAAFLGSALVAGFALSRFATARPPSERDDDYYPEMDDLYPDMSSGSGDAAGGTPHRREAPGHGAISAAPAAPIGKAGQSAGTGTPPPSAGGAAGGPAGSHDPFLDRDGPAGTTPPGSQAFETGQPAGGRREPTGPLDVPGASDRRLEGGSMPGRSAVGGDAPQAPLRLTETMREDPGDPAHGARPASSAEADDKEDKR